MKYGKLEEIVDAGIENMLDILTEEGRTPNRESVEMFIEDTVKMLAQEDDSPYTAEEIRAMYRKRLTVPYRTSPIRLTAHTPTAQGVNYEDLFK